VLLARNHAFWRKERYNRIRALDKLTADLAKLCVIPDSGRGRRRYTSQAALAAVVAQRIAAAGLTGVVSAPVVERVNGAGHVCWVVGSIAVEQPAWEAHLARLGWQVYLTSTTVAQYSVAQIVAAYHGQVVHERGFARLKRRAVHIRPVYVRDEQRIAGLVWLLMLALRVLVVCEQRLRAALAARAKAWAD
jgi:hypothetical protein